MSDAINDEKRVVQTFTISFEPSGAGGEQRGRTRGRERGHPGSTDAEQLIASERIDPGSLRVASRHGI